MIYEHVIRGNTSWFQWPFHRIWLFPGHQYYDIIMFKCCPGLELNHFLSLQVTASPRRAAQKCERTSTTCISSTISRLCLNCLTGWSPVLKRAALTAPPHCVSHTVGLPRNDLSLSHLSLRTQSAIRGRSVRRVTPQMGQSRNRSILG